MGKKNIIGDVAIQGALDLTNATVTGLPSGGVDTSNLVTLDSEQAITGKKTFNVINIGSSAANWPSNMADVPNLSGGRVVFNTNINPDLPSNITTLIETSKYIILAENWGEETGGSQLSFINTTNGSATFIWGSAGSGAGGWSISELILPNDFMSSATDISSYRADILNSFSGIVGEAGILTINGEEAATKEWVIENVSSGGSIDTTADITWEGDHKFNGSVQFFANCSMDYIQCDLEANFNGAVKFIDAANFYGNVDFTEATVTGLPNGDSDTDTSPDTTIATFQIAAENTTITLQNLTDLTSIDWGDGTVDTNLSHTYAAIGEYKCKIYNVTSIDSQAFYNCSNLTSIVISDSTTSIGEYAFKNCANLISVSIPNSVTNIGQYAFQSCTKLTSIEIPNSVISIGDFAFSFCYGLTSMVIPDSVTSLGGYSFKNCFYLTTITLSNNITSIGNETFFGCSRLNEIKIPYGVTSIGNSAFYNCSALTSMVLPGRITSIGSSALSGSGLTSIVIPASVTSIGSYAFEDCSRLTSVEIYGSATEVGTEIFMNCIQLASVYISDGLTSIGEQMFDKCSKLTSITIPTSVTSINKEAFNECSGLTSVVIPNSVTSIDVRAFGNCSNLTSIEIGNSVASLNSTAFYNCSNLTKVTFKQLTPLTYNTSWFSGLNISTIIVPQDSVEAYKTAWSSVASKITSETPATQEWVNTNAPSGGLTKTKVTLAELQALITPDNMGMLVSIICKDNTKRDYNGVVAPMLKIGYSTLSTSAPEVFNRYISNISDTYYNGAAVIQFNEYLLRISQSGVVFNRYMYRINKTTLEYTSGNEALKTDFTDSNFDFYVYK